MAGAESPIFAAMWERERQTVAEQVAAGIAAHVEGEDHRRPRGLGLPHWTWDSGAEGTPLTASAVRPAGWVRVPFPCEINNWFSESYPAGTATILLKAAAPGTALATASTILTIAHSGTEASDDTFTPVAVEKGTRLTAFLTANATCEQVSLNLEVRRT